MDVGDEEIKRGSERATWRRVSAVLRQVLDLMITCGGLSVFHFILLDWGFGERVKDRQGAF
jgi:hypothetical protein